VNKKNAAMHSLRYLDKFDNPTPDAFHKIYFGLTKDYLEGKSILNIGCWTGNYETMFREKTSRVVSIDLNYKALQVARRANSRFGFLAANALSLPFKEKSFETVTLFTVLEHLPMGSEEKVFRQINKVLQQGGVLVITTPHDELTGNILDVAHWLVGHRHYNAGALKSMLINCGFEIEKLSFKGGFLSNFSIPFFYLFKYLFGMNIYKNAFVEKMLKKEYNKEGYRDIFLICRKQRDCEE